MRAKEKLVAALVERGAPPLMIEHAKQGFFDDFESPEVNPIMMLVEACRAADMEDMAQRAIRGEFDGTKEDSDAWAESPEGKEAFAELRRGLFFERTP